MNFKNVKIFFIILLLAVNLLLIFGYMRTSNADAYIDEQTIVNLTNILDENGIQINTDTIPKQRYSSSIIEVPFDTGYYERLARAISLCERESINILPDNSIKLIMTNGDSFNLNNRFSIEFSHNENAIVSAGEFESTVKNALESKTTKLQNASLSSQEKKLIRDFLLPPEMCPDDSCFSYKIAGVYSTGDETKLAVCEQILNEVPVRSHLIYIEISESNIIRAAGTWFYPEVTESYTYELYDQLSILFEEIDHKNTRTELDSTEKNSTYSITDMKFTYCVYWNSRQNGLYFVPAWKITTSMDETRVYNAANCELYE